MKRTVAILVCILTLFSVFALSDNVGVKQKSMSLLGIADYSSNNNFFYNPSSVFLHNQKTKFIFSSNYSDTHKSADEKLILKPQTSFKTEFVSKNVSMMLDVCFKAENEPVFKDNRYYYDLERDVTFNINLSSGFENLSFGVGVSGGSGMEKKNVSNVIYQSLFGSFDRLEDSQFISFRLGTMYKLDLFSFGLTADQVLFYTGANNEMTVDHACDYISGGVYWAQSKYAKRGRLNKWVFNVGLECVNIFNPEERSLALGGEASLQLTNEHSVSFRTGTSVHTDDLSEIRHTFGFGARLGMFDVGAYIDTPFDIFKGEKEPILLNLNVSLIK